MKNNYIYDCVADLIDKYNTSNPFELMDLLDIQCRSSNLDSLKGYCVIIHGIKYVAINEMLSWQERKIVAAHELGHILLHSDKLKAAAHHDLNIYDMADKTEYQATCSIVKSFLHALVECPISTGYFSFISSLLFLFV